VDPDPKVRVRFPVIVVEVVGLWERGGLGGWAYRKSRRDDRGSVRRHRGLVAGPIFFVAFVDQPQSDGHSVC
jgi:hypothetical protein